MSGISRFTCSCTDNPVDHSLYSRLERLQPIENEWDVECVMYYTTTNETGIVSRGHRD